MPAAHNELIVEDGPVTRLTINRPERHNAINTEVGDAIVDIVNRVGRDPSVQVLVLAGEGRSFCSGDDVSEGGDASIPDYPWKNPYHAPHIAAFNLERHPYFRLQPLLRRIPQMVIAQVQGYCMGSGFDLMLASDYAIADPDAKLRMVIPATAYLPKYVGLKQATRLILDDRFISGTEAAELGLVTSVAEHGQAARGSRRAGKPPGLNGARTARLSRRGQGSDQPLALAASRRRPAHAADHAPDERPVSPTPLRT